MAVNPFQYGAIVSGGAFGDRDAEARALLDDMRSGQNVVIVSPRRYGKTSLVARVTEQARAEEILVGYVDLFATPTPEALAEHLATTLLRDVLGPLEGTLERLRHWFARLPRQPAMSFSSDGTVSVTLAAAPRDPSIHRVLEELLGVAGRVARERDRRVVLVLDEFQEIVEIAPALPGLLRSVFQRQAEVCHVFLGSHRHVMQQMFADDRAQPLYRSGRVMQLGPIPPDAFAAFIERRFAETGGSIDEAAVRVLLERTECLPYETQEVASYAWASSAARGRPCDVACVEEAWAQGVRANGARCAQVWDVLSTGQKQVLAAVAEEGEAVYSEGYRRRHGLRSASSVQGAIARLLRLDLIAEEGGVLRVPDVFLRSWVRRTVQAGGAAGLAVPFPPDVDTADGDEARGDDV